MSPCSQHLPNKVWLNCSELGVSGSPSEMSVSPSSPGPGDTEVMVTEEEDIGPGVAEEVTSSPASLLYVEFRKYVSINQGRLFGETQN